MASERLQSFRDMVEVLSISHVHDANAAKYLQMQEEEDLLDVLTRISESQEKTTSNSSPYRSFSEEEKADPMKNRESRTAAAGIPEAQR